MLSTKHSCHRNTLHQHRPRSYADHRRSSDERTASGVVPPLDDSATVVRSVAAAAAGRTDDGREATSDWRRLGETEVMDGAVFRRNTVVEVTDCW